jgi:8-oxo-dGTP diphosphatase
MPGYTPTIGNLNPHVSVDCVIFGFDFEELKVLLIERGLPDDHESGTSKPVLMLPGDLVYDNENLDQSAMRVLKALTSLENIFLEQFSAFGEPSRVRKEEDIAWLRSMRSDPEARVITVGYYSLVRLDKFKPAPAYYARSADWYPVSAVHGLAFDHDHILECALARLKYKARVEPIGFELLPQKFTLGNLQKLYEAILGSTLDKRNFRRKILSRGILIELDEKQQGVPHKPAKLYQFESAQYDKLKGNSFDFLL